MSIPTRIFGVRPLGGPSGCLGEDGSKIVHAVHGTPLEDRPFLHQGQSAVLRGMCGLRPVTPTF